MKKVTVLFCAALALLAVPALATVAEIEIILGVAGDFNAAAGTLAWSEGVEIFILDDESTLYGPYDVVVASTFTGGYDTSAGGIASATFTAGSWSVLVKDGSTDIMTITGNLISSYNEVETGPGFLYGGAVANVSSITVHDASYFGPTVSFDGGNTIGVTGSTILPGDINDYLSDWSSGNVIINLYADETVIPEPATMTLLGLGVLGLLRKRRA